MKTKALLIVSFLGLLGSFCLANDEVPVAISPGSNASIAGVESRCPTFSWSGVDWAKKYRVSVFGVEEEMGKFDKEMKLSRQPVLSQEIAAGGSSWTPGLSQALNAGADYAWCVGAMDANGTWTWSEMRCFRVEGSTRQVFGKEVQVDLEKEKGKFDAKGEALTGEPVNSAMGKTDGKKGSGRDPQPGQGSEGAYSTFYGLFAGASNSNDSNSNSFFGSSAGYFTSTGLYNVFFGYQAGIDTTTGSHNTFVGSSAGHENINGDKNTFMGDWTGYNTTSGHDNTFVGATAGHANTVGNYNTFLGCDAGFSNISGLHNTFVGRYSGWNNASGCCNTFVGNGSGEANTTGESNIFVGGGAGQTNNGSNNTFMGYAAGHENSTGSRNVFLGYFAGYNETGSDKLYIDNSDTSSPLIYGDFSADTVKINGTLETTTTGSNNVLAVTRTDGASFKLSAMGASGQLGTISAHPVNFMVNNVKRLTIATNGNVGIGVTVPTYPLHMASGAHCTTGGVWTNSSSLALKQDIAPLNAEAAEAALRDLKPVTYAYKADASEKCVGFIAEEVPELVAMNDRKSLSPMDIVAVLTKVVQEQQRELEELRKEIALIKGQSQK